MTGEDKATLRVLAEGATPGWDHAQIEVGHNPHHAALVSSYTAAAHRAAVLALLDEVERLREALRLSLDAWATTGVSNGAIREAQTAARIALEQST